MRAAAIALVVLAASTAHANPPGLTPIGMTPIEPSAAPADTGTPSYRHLTLASDAIAVGLFLIAVDKADEGSEDLAILSVGTYLLGAPLVHIAKGRTGHGLASFTMRLGFPLLGAIIGDGLRSRAKCADYCEDDGGDEAVLGAMAGLVAASAIDSIYLAKGEPPKPRPAPLWSPSVRGTQGGFALGVRGRF